MAEKKVTIKKAKKFDKYIMMGDKATKEIVLIGINIDKEEAEYNSLIESLSKLEKKVFYLTNKCTFKIISDFFKEKKKMPLKEINCNINMAINKIYGLIYTLGGDIEENIKKELSSVEKQSIELYINYPKEKIKDKLHISEDDVNQSIIFIKKEINKILSEDEKDKIKLNLSDLEENILDKWLVMTDERVIETVKNKDTKVLISKVKYYVQEYLSYDHICNIKKAINDNNIVNKEVFDIWFGYSIENVVHAVNKNISFTYISNKYRDIICKEISYKDIKTIKKQLTDFESEVFDMWIQYSYKNAAFKLKKNEKSIKNARDRIGKKLKKVKVKPKNEKDIEEVKIRKGKLINDTYNLGKNLYNIIINQEKKYSTLYGKMITINKPDNYLNEKIKSYIDNFINEKDKNYTHYKAMYDFYEEAYMQLKELANNTSNKEIDYSDYVPIFFQDSGKSLTAKKENFSNLKGSLIMLVKPNEISYEIQEIEELKMFMTTSNTPIEIDDEEQSDICSNAYINISIKEEGYKNHTNYNDIYGFYEEACKKLEKLANNYNKEEKDYANYEKVIICFDDLEKKIVMKKENFSNLVGNLINSDEKQIIEGVKKYDVCSNAYTKINNEELEESVSNSYTSIKIPHKKQNIDDSKKSKVNPDIDYDNEYFKQKENTLNEQYLELFQVVKLNIDKLDTDKLNKKIPSNSLFNIKHFYENLIDNRQLYDALNDWLKEYGVPYWPNKSIRKAKIPSIPSTGKLYLNYGLNETSSINVKDWNTNPILIDDLISISTLMYMLTELWKGYQLGDYNNTSLNNISNITDTNYDSDEAIMNRADKLYNDIMSIYKMSYPSEMRIYHKKIKKPKSKVYINIKEYDSVLMAAWDIFYHDCFGSNNPYNSIPYCTKCGKKIKGKPHKERKKKDLLYCANCFKEIKKERTKERVEKYRAKKKDNQQDDDIKKDTI